MRGEKASFLCGYSMSICRKVSREAVSHISFVYIKCLVLMFSL